jgi:hypothetical protein
MPTPRRHAAPYYAIACCRAITPYFRCACFHVSPLMPPFFAFAIYFAAAFRDAPFAIAY